MSGWMVHYPRSIEIGEALEEPGVADEVGDENVLFGGGGVKAFEVAAGEGFVVAGER